MNDSQIAPMKQDHSNTIQRLQWRLQAIADSLRQHPQGLALMGLGSTGAEIARMDAWSDLDFFALVAPGYKQHFIQDLSWLASIHPIAWHFKNTEDGYKLLFEDGVFCEFAVFEPQELAHTAYIGAKFIWQEDGVSDDLLQSPLAPEPQSQDRGYLLGELLTNLYVGLCRFHRGEHISAMRFIQVYALDRLIALLDLDAVKRHQAMPDVFCPDRRVEQNSLVMFSGQIAARALVKI